MATTKAKKKPRSAAQKAATKRMLAAAKKARKAKAAAASGTTKPKRKRKAAAKATPAAKKAKRSAKAGVKKAGKRSTSKRTSAKPKKGKTMKKRNRAPGAKSILKDLGGVAMGAGAGVANAIAADVVLGLPMVPAAVKTGPGSLLARAALAIGGGLAIEKLGSKQIGRDAAVAALAVTLHKPAKEALQTAVPSLQLGEIAGLAEAIGLDDDSLLDGLAEAIDLEGGNVLPFARSNSLAGDLASIRVG